MKTLKLGRVRHDLTRGTAGVLVFPDDKQLMSIERPWLGNRPNISCIPAGTYTCHRDLTGRFRVYRLADVPGRSAIEIHVANHASELQGCIALGTSRARDNFAVNNSRKGCARLISAMGDEPFELEISWAKWLAHLEIET